MCDIWHKVVFEKKSRGFFSVCLNVHLLVGITFNDVLDLTEAAFLQKGQIGIHSHIYMEYVYSILLLVGMDNMKLSYNYINSLLRP